MRVRTVLPLRSTALVLVLVFVLGGATAACDFRQFTAESTADLLHAGSPQFNTLADLEVAEAAAPANLVTMEAVWRVAPRNQDVLIELAMGWGSYAYGFMEDGLERARDAGDDGREESFRARAQEAYRRAEQFGFVLMATRQPVAGGPQTQVRAGIEPWRRYLARFTRREDVPALYWTAQAWASRVALSLDDAGTLLDLPFAVAAMERARALDPDYYHGGIYAFFGAYYASTPASLGGRPDAARREFESALRVARGRYLLFQVLYARNYAVQQQDRALFRQLLEQVVHAGDVMPEERLSNQVAKRRARRYLAQIDELFGPDAAAPAPAPAPTAAPAAAPARAAEERR
jgi:hypothetical protein